VTYLRYAKVDKKAPGGGALGLLPALYEEEEDSEGYDDTDANSLESSSEAQSAHTFGSAWHLRRPGAGFGRHSRKSIAKESHGSDSATVRWSTYTASFRASLGVTLVQGKDYWRKWIRRRGGGPWDQYKFYEDKVVVEGFAAPSKKSRGAPPVSVARVQGVQPGDILDKVDKYRLQGSKSAFECCSTTMARSDIVSSCYCWHRY